MDLIQILVRPRDRAVDLVRRPLAEGIARQRDQPAARKGHAHAHDAGEDVGMKPGRRPDDRRTPVVPDQDRLAFAQRMDEADQIADQRMDAIGIGLPEFRGTAIAALVDGDDAVAGPGDRRHLEAPGIPELGKAVDEDHQRSLALFDQMQPDAVDVDQPVLRFAHPAPLPGRLTAARLPVVRNSSGSAFSVR